MTPITGLFIIAPSASRGRYGQESWKRIYSKKDRTPDLFRDTPASGDEQGSGVEPKGFMADETVYRQLRSSPYIPVTLPL
jgi:hypothetical protein